jgi:uncharacterized protein (DUF302 family)
MADYSFSTTVSGPLERVREMVTTALADQGFGILTEIDVKATMKKKLDVDIDPYLILGACNAPFAHEALSTDPSIGVLLPCNVVLRETDSGVTVEFMDPAAVLTLVDTDGVAEIAAEVRTKLQRARDSLEGIS